VRISHVLIEGSDVSLDVVDDLVFAPLEEGVTVAAVPFATHGEAHFVRIAAGGYFVLHTGPESGFVQVVHGRGKLVLPGDVRVPFAAPELFLFRPNTLHGWNDIEEDTLMAACLIS
jgi:quercetin dioxygenase-like cupin family protein